MKKTCIILLAVLFVAAVISCSAGVDSSIKNNTDEVAQKVAEFAKKTNAEIEPDKEHVPPGTRVPYFTSEGRILVLNLGDTEDASYDLALFREDVRDTSWVYWPIFEDLCEFAGNDDVGLVLRFFDASGNKIIEDYLIDKNHVPTFPEE